MRGNKAMCKLTMYVHYQHCIWAPRGHTLSDRKFSKSTSARVFSCEGENIVGFHHFHMEGDCVCTLPTCPTTCLLCCMQLIKISQFPNMVDLLNLFYSTISRMDTLIVGLSSPRMGVEWEWSICEFLLQWDLWWKL
jgi:hypothetical protein